MCLSLALTMVSRATLPLDIAPIKTGSIDIHIIYPHVMTTALSLEKRPRPISRSQLNFCLNEYTRC